MPFFRRAIFTHTVKQVTRSSVLSLFQIGLLRFDLLTFLPFWRFVQGIGDVDIESVVETAINTHISLLRHAVKRAEYWRCWYLLDRLLQVNWSWKLLLLLPWLLSLVISVRILVQWSIPDINVSSVLPGFLGKMYRMLKSDKTCVTFSAIILSH